MFLGVLLTSLFIQVYSDDGTVKDMKPYILPIPYEMPNRNDKAEQCWLRIEDADLIETLSTYCHIAHSFLRSYIHENNLKKMTDDDINVSLWDEDPGNPLEEDEDFLKVPQNNQKNVKNWRSITVMDPITHMRLYVSQKADCRLVMNNRNAMSNYKVDCETLLYFFNERLGNSAMMINTQNYLIIACIILIFINIGIIN